MNDQIKTQFREKIYDFVDYRSFLKCYVEEKRGQDSYFTIGRLAKDLRLQDTSSINKILRGQRHAGSDVIDQLCGYFQFGYKETKYFCDLVALSKENKDSKNRVYIMERLKELHPSKEFKLLNSDEFNSMAKWYCVAIREMVRLSDFKEDPKWISKRLRKKVPKSEIRLAIQILLKVGLLKRDEKGKLTISNPHYQTTQDIASEAIKRFHESTLDIAKDAIRSVDIDKRHISASVVSIQTNDLKKTKSKIDSFQDDLCKSTESNTGEEVYQLSIQFFPLTQHPKNGGTV